MKRNKILKEAGVLLIGAILIFSSITAMATTSDKTDLTATSSKIETKISNMGPCPLQNNPILWDNFVSNTTAAYHAQDDPPEVPTQWDSFSADDFIFDEDTEVYWVFWQMVYWNCNPAEGPKDYHYDWNITFFEDDGSGYHPGDIFVGPITIADADIYKSLPYLNSSTLGNGMWNCGASAFLPEPMTFNAGAKYWISIYSIGPHFPQSGWYAHNESLGGILLNEANFKSEHWGWPEWTNFSNGVHEEALDMNFILGGDHPFEVTLSKGLGVTATITNRLPEPYDTINVTATFTATGGLVLGRTKTVVIGDIDAGATDTAKWFPIGIGNIAIEVFVISEGGVPGRGNTTGFLLLFFLI